jgi:superfamily I DNA/RNA helicase
MIQPFFVAGEAGAGKTRKLMEQADVAGGELLTKPDQRALAMAVMHGARRQLLLTLDRYCPKLPVTVSTVHSFALGIVNRWRRSLGISAPVTACEASRGLAEKYARTQATFDEVITLACKLLESSTVCSTLAESYPVVIVDEFQDCTATILPFVQSLGRSAKLLLAADHFQLLDDEGKGCPAVDWARRLREEGHIFYEDLTGCRRTENPAILQAARALRENVRAPQSTVPVYHGYKPAQVAYRMFERFRGWGTADQITTGTCALIALSLDDTQLNSLLESFQNQLTKLNIKQSTNRTVNWSYGSSESKHREELFTELGINSTFPAGEEWNTKQIFASKRASTVAQDVVRFCKLRGIAPIPQELVAEFAKLAIHNVRAFGRGSPRFQVLTVHGAKNREFDHVFVFWGYKNAGWSVQQQRKLLYNAVTRARVDCTVLVLGDMHRTEGDPVINLLGPSHPAIDPAWSKKKKTSTPGHKAKKRPAG